MVFRGAILAVVASTLLAAVGFVAAPAIALAYEGCNDVDGTDSVDPSSGPGGANVTFTVKLSNCQRGDQDEEARESEAEKAREAQQQRNGQGDGSPAANRVVQFSQESGPDNCHVTFSAPSGTTNAQGIVKVTVTLPPNCPGTYQLLAKGTGFSTGASVQEDGGFFPGNGQGQNGAYGTQNQSVKTTGSSQQQSPPILPLLVVCVGLALLAAGGIGLIRRPRSKTP